MTSYEYLPYEAAELVNISGLIMGLIAGIITLVACWKLFQKAGLEGWKAIIPFYSSYCLYKIAFGRDKGWLFILELVPCVGFVVNIIKSVKLAQNFGKGTGFTVGLILLEPIFTLILGFDSSEYIGEPLY